MICQRLTHFNSALNLKNASIFGVSIFDFIFPEVFWPRNSDSDEDLLKVYYSLCIRAFPIMMMDSKCTQRAFQVEDL